MEPLIQVSSKKVNQWNNNYISPGAVGALGDLNQNVRLKQSTPALPMRWAFTNPQLVQRAGQNVQDGLVSSNGGLGAETVIKDVYSDTIETRCVGVKYQDIRMGDLTGSERVLARPQDSWKAQTANVLNARVTGQQFLPLPGGIERMGVPRGTGLTHTSIYEPRQNILNSLYDDKNTENPDMGNCPNKTLQQKLGLGSM